MDNKLLFDHTRATHNHNIGDKRSATEMLIVKEDVQKRNVSVRWVATYQMVGDILTKIGVSPNLLTRVLDWGQFVLVQDASIRPERSTNKNYFGCVISVFCSFLVLRERAANDR